MLGAADRSALVPSQRRRPFWRYAQNKRHIKKAGDDLGGRGEQIGTADRLVFIGLSKAPVESSAIYNFKNGGSKQIASIAIIGKRSIIRSAAITATSAPVAGADLVRVRVKVCDTVPAMKA